MSFPTGIRLILLLLSGIAIGIGLYTFVYAKGYSYLQNDPKACVNCHIMRENYDSWVHSSHKNATCNDCHTPDHPIMKWVSKAENGFWHSKGFTLGDYPDPLRIRQINKDVLINNCIRCHSDLTHHMNKDRSGQPANCLHCHSDVGHGARR